MMNTPSTQSVLPTLSELKPLGIEDQSCLDEVREVLAKHGALGRFGVTLLHSHFPMAPDEILEEYCDEENRTMTLKPMKKSELNEVLFTAWNLENGQPLVGCIVFQA